MAAPAARGAGRADAARGAAHRRRRGRGRSSPRPRARRRLLILRFFRSARTDDIEREFSGVGASLYAGRWNSRGRRVVYLASSRALALLETLVHVETAPIATPRFFFPVDVPEEVVEVLPESELPKGWNAADVPEAARAAGDRWLASGRSAALRVPSAVLPLEPNLVVDPLHPAFARLVVHPAERADLDPRLVRLRPLAPTAPFRPRKPRTS